MDDCSEFSSILSCDSRDERCPHTAPTLSALHFFKGSYEFSCMDHSDHIKLNSPRELLKRKYTTKSKSFIKYEIRQPRPKSMTGRANLNKLLFGMSAPNLNHHLNLKQMKLTEFPYKILSRKFL